MLFTVLLLSMATSRGTEHHEHMARLGVGQFISAIAGLVYGGVNSVKVMPFGLLRKPVPRWACDI
jgi:hypothetical protein